MSPIRLIFLFNIYMYTYVVRFTFEHRGFCDSGMVEKRDVGYCRIFSDDRSNHPDDRHPAGHSRGRPDLPHRSDVGICTNHGGTFASPGSNGG